MYEERFQTPNVKRPEAGSAEYPAGMLVALSVSVAPLASVILGLTSTFAASVFEVAMASNCAEIAGAPFTVVFPVNPAAVKVAIMSSTDLLKRSRCSAYD